MTEQKLLQQLLLSEAAILFLQQVPHPNRRLQHSHRKRETLRDRRLRSGLKCATRFLTITIVADVVDNYYSQHLHVQLQTLQKRVVLRHTDVEDHHVVVYFCKNSVDSEMKCSAPAHHST